MGFLKPIISRAFLREKAISYDEKLRLGEDYALYVKALRAGARFRLVGACGYVAVERHDSISSRHSAADLTALAAFDAECLAVGEALGQSERAALEAHWAATLRKVDYHAFLERKWQLGAWPALRSLLGIPTSLPYITAETIRARWKRALSALGYPDTREARLLIGVAGARLSVTSRLPADTTRAWAGRGAR
jgi:succinoglycan biosynthesis protein ExoU